MLGLFGEDTAAVGVRPQLNFDGSETTLHSLGCLWRTTVFRKLNETMLPDFPRFDVGERAISTALAAGFDFQGMPNTYCDSLLQNQVRDDRLRRLQADRTVDGQGEVLFMHLGRGIPTATGEKSGGETRIRDWVGVWRNLAKNLDPELRA